MKTIDVRRLTGPGPLLPTEGAALDVALAPGEEAALETWREEAATLRRELGWADGPIAVRRARGGATLAIAAPFDALYTACDLAEAAWAEAAARHRPELDAPPDRAAVLAGLRASDERERRPALRALRAAADARGVDFLWDADAATVGHGAGSSTWPIDALPDPAEIDWSTLHDAPTALVTGTNGKTTTVRLLAAIGRASERTTGHTSTEGVFVGDEAIARGDYSGPGGARTLLRDRRVEVAALEIARGGLLRRGLAVRRAAAALITNAAADHLGEYGITDVAGIADAKMAVARGLRPGGRLFLNAQDAALAARARDLPADFPIGWFALDRDALEARLREFHPTLAPPVAWLDGDRLMLARDGRSEAITTAAEVPIALGGAARHNLANALGALLLASELGLSDTAIRSGLAEFGRLGDAASEASGNPGRAELIVHHGVAIYLDYAHNPHGFAALRETLDRLPAARRILLFGQAGDRDDESIRTLARAAWDLAPAVAIVKEMPSMLRGRRSGEVPALIEAELRALGGVEIVHAESELAGLEAALGSARAGDLLVLLIHTHRAEARARIEGWRSGAPAPAERA